MAEIIGRSSNLAERLHGHVVPTGQDQVAAGHRLQRWKQLAAKGDGAVFQNVLGESGLTGASDQRLCSLLGGVCPANGSARPDWADLLLELTAAISTAFTSSGAAGDPPLAARRSIPFVTLYWPIAVFARKRVETSAPERIGQRLGEKAWSGLSLHLLKRISAICSLALQPSFQAFAAVRSSGDAFAFFAEEPRRAGGPASASIYRGFVAEQGEEGLTRFFLEQPVAARLVAQVTLYWIEFVLEFLQRLDADAGELSVRFFDGQSVGEIISCQAGISDPHHGGRSVLILHFAVGAAIVYKPRPMQIDATFFDLLKWWNTRSGQISLATLDVLLRAEYGWEKMAVPAPCSSREGGRLFYRRAGALLCLLHALRGIDFHYENMIAAGDNPVMVDLEALCHPEVNDPTEWSLDGSVLRTGMLPIRERCFGEQRFLVRSALGAPSRQLSALDQVRWQRINSDAMQAWRGLTRRQCLAHQPRFQGRPLALRTHLADLIDGFRRAAELLSRGSTVGREWDARVAQMNRCKTRLIKRPTLLYAVLVQHSLEPRLLKDGVDRSIALQALPASPAGDASRQAEIAAMETLDIPYFSKTGGPPPERKDDIAQQIADIRAAVLGRLTLEQGSLRRLK